MHFNVSLYLNEKECYTFITLGKIQKVVKTHCTVTLCSV